MSARVSNHPPERLHYGDQPSQFLEFHRPPADAPRPLVVMIHGGFWRARYSLSHSHLAAAALAAAGFLVANLEYRRVGEPGGGWPGTVQDVKSGILYARERAASFGGDPARTIVLGHSAGGHLALWAAGEIPGLTHAIGLAPVACLETAFTLALSNNAVSEFLGGAPAEFPDRYSAADPARPTHVPRTLIHGDADDIVPIDLTRRFPAPATRIEIPGADHFAVLDPAHPAWQCVLSALGAPLDGPL